MSHQDRYVPLSSSLNMEPCVLKRIFSSHIKFPRCLKDQTRSPIRNDDSWHILEDPSALQMDLYHPE